MHAKELDVELDCPICDGDGIDQTGDDETCRRCEGNGKINRYGPNDPSEKHSGDVVILNETVNHDGALIVERMPISDESTGGFEERYNNRAPNDMTTGAVSGYHQDTKDRVANERMGSNTNENGGYDIHDPDDGKVTELRPEDLHHGDWPENCPECGNSDEMCWQCVIDWRRGRGDDYTAEVFEKMREEVSNAGGK